MYAILAFVCTCALVWAIHGSFYAAGFNLLVAAVVVGAIFAKETK